MSTAASSTGSANIVAAIDVGTNSFHLLVADFDASGHFEVVTREKESVRLGSGADDMKRLSAEAMDRGIAALDRMRRIAEHAGALDILAVATSAVREAGNNHEFVARARDEAGIEVEVVSGVEEARLIHLGVLQSAPVFDRRHLVFDIGGGSTEFIVGEGSRPLLLRSLKLGAIRLTDRFFPEGVVKPGSVDECALYVDSFVGGLEHQIAELGFDVAVGSSGTIITLARMAGALRGDRQRRTGNLAFTSGELETLVDELARRTTPQKRRELPGLEERRSDIIVGGAVLTRQIARMLHIDRVEVSEHSLREGIVFEQRRRASAPGLDPFHRLGDLRRSAVMYVASRFHEDLTHAQHITDLALEVFDGLTAIHGLDDDDRDLFEAASLLHNVGVYISHSAHHRHSYYVIRNSEHLAGFTEREVEIVAQVARYHRKSAPKTKHAEFASLGAGDRSRVRWMAGMLRVAIGLDRSNRQVVHRVEVGVDDSQITIDGLVAEGDDASLELFTAEARADLLAATSERSVTIRLCSSGPTGRAAHPASRPRLASDPSHEFHSE
ncbi:MAG: Ppx/GppA phosphatase family protein [Actinomycetota bacterium]|nr:Ppx/GppA phosphatase family protein [Actinomycetota bacterium]